MLPLKYARHWQIAGFVLLASVMVLALVPSLWFWQDDSAPQWQLSDKWMHGLTFAFLAIWFSGQLTRKSFWKLALGLSLFGALIEACQFLVPYRMAEIGDMSADVAGIIVGLTIALLGAGGWSQRLESLMFD